MTYISLPRLAFSGKFHADISTVNNDVRHFHVATFKERYQDSQAARPDGTIANGWFNPSGTGAFRLVDVRITQALLTPGGGHDDPIVGASVNDQIHQSAAKLVDLDPQFQSGSMIFGLGIALTNGKSEFMRATFRPTAFRDLYFGRVFSNGEPMRGVSGASAKFTSVLTDVHWSAAAAGSPVLSQLKAAAEANDDTLSINLMTYAYNAGSSLLGSICGSIGTWKKGEPRSFVAKRRFVPAANGAFSTPEGIGFFDADVSDCVSLDLGNALALDANRRDLLPIGKLVLALITEPDLVPTLQRGKPTVQAALSEGDGIGGTQMIQLAEIPYMREGWLQQTAGIIDFKIPAAAREMLGERPLAVVSPTGHGANRYRIVIRETISGLFLRADDFEVRMDAPPTGRVAAQRTLHARQFGKPYPDAPIGIGLLERQSGGGEGFGIDQPTAPIPDINFPRDCVTLTIRATTDADGTATVTFLATDPGNPRGYIDGQIFQFDYGFAICGVSEMSSLDLLVLHVRNAVTVPDHPDWKRDVKPFMQQYDNLYPSMSRNLFSLTDPEIARQHASLLTFAFQRPIDDPNHMPATRDLSDGKRRIVLNWLAQFMPGQPALAEPTPSVIAAADDVSVAASEARLETLPAEAIDRTLTVLGDAADSKGQAIRALLAARRSTREPQS